MTIEMTGIIRQLRTMRVAPSVLKLIRVEAEKVQVPAISAQVQGRLQEVSLEHGRALLVLNRDGEGYSVFSPDGHAALCASAKKHKPWEHSHLRKANRKH